VQTWSFAAGRWSEGELADAEFTWFNIEWPDEDALKALQARFGLHPLAVEDCLSPNLHAPKIDAFRDHVFIVFVAPGGEGGTATEEFDAFLGERFVITYADRPLRDVGAVLEMVRGEGVGRRLRPGPDGVLYEIVDRMVDGFLPAAHRMGDELDVLEDEILHGGGSERSSRAIVEMRSRGGRLRRLLAPQLMVMQRLSRGEVSHVQEANRIYFRDIYDHLVRIDLALEGVREDAEMALSTYLSALNNRMNEVMKVLSVVAALALPATVIAGIFGTNFDNVPGLHSNWGFALMIGAMAAIAATMALYFRRRGWW
jgi:magnesium transporter